MEAKQLSKALMGTNRQIDEAIKGVLRKYIMLIYNDAMSGLGASASIKATYSVEYTENGFRASVSTNNEIAAYIEFGTGSYAATYLSGKPQEMVDEALQFFVSGEGRMPAKPYLFPAYYRNREKIRPEIDKAIQDIFNKL